MSLLKFPNLNNCFVNNDNPYLIKLVIDILKRLIQISIVMYPNHQNSINFLKNLEEIIDNGLQTYIADIKTQNKKIPEMNIYITIKTLHLLFEID